MAQRKISKISVVDQVADEMKEKIVSGEWKPGDKLPSESDIAQMYGVNRLSVRMALQKLGTLGVIETRVGEGSFVQEFSFYPVLSEMVDFLQYGERLDDIREMRFLIERASALKAAEHCTPADADELKEVLGNYCNEFDRYNSEATDQNLHSFLKADLALHMQIVKLSGNLLYLEIYQMIQKLITLHISQLINQRKTSQQTDAVIYRQMHIQLCDSIISHNREMTKKTLSALLNIDPADEYFF